MKKLVILALVLAVVLSVSGGLVQAAPGDISPTPAFSDIAGNPAEAALTVLGSLGVFTGSYGLGGAVDPNGVLTREAFCKVVVVAKGKATQADLMKNIQPQFNDGAQVSRWAWGYVNVAVGDGIIGGFPDNTFKGSLPVTYAQAIKMLVCAIPGHKAQTNAALGWPNQWVFYGVSNGFTGDVSPDPNANCTRGDMARMLYATMLVEPLKTDGTPESGKAILHTMGYNANYWAGTFYGASGGTFTISHWMGTIPLADKVYVVGASAYAALVGQSVACVADASGNVVAIIQSSGSGSTSGLFKALGSDTSGNYIELKSGAKVYYIPDIPVTLNNKGWLDQNSFRVDDQLVINLDSDGKAVAATAKRYDLLCRHVFLPGLPSPPAPPPGIPPMNLFFSHQDVLASVTVSSGVTNTRVTFPGTSPFDYKTGLFVSASLVGATLEIGAEAVVTINGAPATRDGLKKDDIVKMASFGAEGYTGASSIVEVAAARRVLDGVVSSKRYVTDTAGTKTYITVSGAEYLIDPDHHYVADPFTGSHYKFALDADGTVFYSIGIPPSITVVYVTSCATISGPPTTYTITYDYRGTTVTKACIGDASALVNGFWKLGIDGPTDMVVMAVPVAPSVACTVAAASGSSVTVQTVPPGSTYFGNDSDVGVYERVGSSFVYRGCASLTMGQAVLVGLDGTLPAVIVYPMP